jgi:class 3 adenylate cyclase
VLHPGQGGDAALEIHDTRYARASDGAYIAYQMTGEGPVDLTWELDWFGNLDAIWEDPNIFRFFSAVSRFCRLIVHDRRATGLSSRNVPVPNLETRVSDLTAVLTAAGSKRPVLGGMFEGGAPNVLLAASHPEAVRSIVWYSPQPRSSWTPDYPWGSGPDEYQREQTALDSWGTADYDAAFIGQEGAIGHELPRARPGLRGMQSRQTATPDVARELSRVWYETDVREVLRAVQVPTLLIALETADEVAQAEYVAGLMPDATVATLQGDETSWDLDEMAELIRVFIGVDRPVELGSVLCTVLFTDIVRSTEREAALGDHAWKGLLERHHALVRESLARYGGVEGDTAGDGFFATFDGPARGIRCALEIVERVRELGLEVRAGVHTGECETIDAKVGGLAVTIGARVSALAGPSEVLVSQTVKDLTAGSGLHLEDAGEHELKGVPDAWHLYRVVG